MKLKKRIKKLELWDKVRNQQIAELQYSVDELMRIINECDLEKITKRSDEL